jgi:FlaA1/EpsC-like NDP-sugar epimerase
LTDERNGLSLVQRRLLALGIYAAVTAVAYTMAFQLRFEFAPPPQHIKLLLQTLPLLVGIRVVSAAAFRLSRGRWRFVGPRDMVRLAAALVAGTVIYFAAMAAGMLPAVPRSVLLIELFLTANLTGGVWLAYRLSFEQLRRARTVGRGGGRALLVGAGEAGNLLAREMQRMSGGPLPVAFVDDAPLMWGTRLQGLEVIGGTHDLPAIARHVRATEIILAVPSASPEELRRIVAQCHLTALPFKVLPGIAEVLKGDVRVTQLREVRTEDLLGREPVSLDLPELAQDIGGRVVLITGAAGSIGSELARQVAHHGPAILVLLDQAETPLFYLDLELRREYPEVSLVCAVADIADRRGVERIFAQYRPSHVFHAAAYKHVPLMEANPAEAVRNNVIGTHAVALAAAGNGARKFVLVSTDKAVAPASVMGATKRLSELLICELQPDYPDTTFCAVRFGNVLGSNGSVIPLFRKQLEDGQPLTVTHPEVTRYFMTIPEAVQLILQSSLLAEVRGRIAMLDMGEPVPIVELAENLLRLSGSLLDPQEQIVFTGLRPGEKLHEELTAPQEETIPTPIAKVRLIVSPPAESVSVADALSDWEASLAMGAVGIMLGDLERLFPDLRLAGAVAATPPPAARRGPELLRVERASGAAG